ncbi:hypothetical protein ACFQ3H_13360, partial [Paralysiella testudinis]
MKDFFNEVSRCLRYFLAPDKLIFRDTRTVYKNAYCELTEEEKSKINDDALWAASSNDPVFLRAKRKYFTALEKQGNFSYRQELAAEGKHLPSDKLETLYQETIALIGEISRHIAWGALLLNQIGKSSLWAHNGIDYAHDDERSYWAIFVQNDDQLQLAHHQQIIAHDVYFACKALEALEKLNFANIEQQKIHPEVFEDIQNLLDGEYPCFRLPEEIE